VTRLGVFEDARHRTLAPLTDLRPTFSIWSGIAPAWRRLEALYGAPIRTVRCRAALAAAAAREIPAIAERDSHDAGTVLLVNGALRVDRTTVSQIPLDGPEEILVAGGRIAAVRLAALSLATLPEEPLPALSETAGSSNPLALLGTREVVARFVDNPWDLVAHNEAMLHADFGIFARTIEPRRLAAASEIGVDCFVGADAAVSSKASLDASEGPILVGAGARVEPFAFVKGPAFIGQGALVRAGCRVEGGSTVGPGCRIGGEVEATILHPFSNKQHDGFLGHSIVGSWANLGAGTTTSDLKNNYGTVRMERDGQRIDTGLRKLGAVIGDHAKLGIGTLLGAGTTIGTAAQVAGAGGVISGAVPAYAWWTAHGRAEHDVDRAVETARTVLGRRGKTLEPDEAALLRALSVDERARAALSAWVAAGEPSR